MKKESREEFNKWVHVYGIVTSMLVYVGMMGFPILISSVYGVWPNFYETWPAFLAVLLFLAPWWPAETVGYMPVLGPGALYMSYITGNVTNLRMPVTVGTINALGIKTNTDECHTMAIIACGASIITSVVILAIGVILSRPLEPVLNAQVLKPAFDYVIPALFGGLVAQTVLKGKKEFFYFLIPLAVCLFFFYGTKVPTSYYMLIVILLSALIYVFDFSKMKKKEQMASSKE